MTDDNLDDVWNMDDFNTYATLRINVARQLRKWNSGLKFGTSYDAMAEYLGRPPQPLHPDDVWKLEMLLGPHGYAIYRAGLARK